MQERLPKPVYKKLKKTIKEGLPLDPDIAEVVACVMKGFGRLKWVQPILPLVPTVDRLTAKSMIPSCRQQGTARHHGILRQGAYQG